MYGRRSKNIHNHQTDHGGRKYHNPKTPESVRHQQDSYSDYTSDYSKHNYQHIDKNRSHRDNSYRSDSDYYRSDYDDSYRSGNSYRPEYSARSVKSNRSVRSQNNPTPLGSDGKFDLERYLGTWYEIGHLPNNFQNGCVRSVAMYNNMEPDEDGNPRISVRNICLNSNNMIVRTINGQGAVFDDSVPPQLMVSFPGFPEPDGVNYVVKETDYSTYAIVGSDDFKTLFLLTREPTIDSELFKYLIERSKFLGYPVEHLILDSRSVQGKIQGGVNGILNGGANNLSNGNGILPNNISNGNGNLPNNTSNGNFQNGASNVKSSSNGYGESCNKKAQCGKNSYNDDCNNGSGNWWWIIIIIIIIIIIAIAWAGYSYYGKDTKQSVQQPHVQQHGESVTKIETTTTKTNQ